MRAPCPETFIEDHTHAHVLVIGLTIAWAVIAVTLQQKRLARPFGAGPRPAPASFKRR